ncbi:MAG: hypothetical protein QNJ08_18985 [Crocosphaera sp.]|nr:hypothetical protein [Crocosphaera sp.]
METTRKIESFAHLAKLSLNVSFKNTLLASLFFPRIIINYGTQETIF